MKQENYLVVGLGITGYAVVNFLKKRGEQVSVCDTRVEPPNLSALQINFPQVEVFLGKLFIPAATTTIVLSPGIALNEPAIVEAQQRGVKILGDIELFAQVVDKPVLAVTGSNGKSTVTTLLGAMAQASGIKAGVGGNLGTAALDLLDPSNECYILELSSFQLETTHSLKSKVVTVLNISPDHMDRYVDLTAYKEAKLRIYTDAEYAVFNRADPLTFAPPHATCNFISFGLDLATAGNYGLIKQNGNDWLARGETALMPVSELAMLGQHNVANALAALAMGEVAGFKLESMLQTLKTFTGLHHRCEVVTKFNDVVWVNDSKGTNVAATVTAITGLADAIKGKWIIVLGGVGKNADFSPLLEPVRDHCKAAILIGEERHNLAQLLDPVTECLLAQDMAEVVALAQQVAHKGDGVLLSPACASFDMFNNYAHRGEQFMDQVLQRTGKHATTTTD